MSFLKLPSKVAFSYCRHVGRLSSIIKIKGSNVTGIARTPVQQYLARYKSVFTKETTVSSISSAVASKPHSRREHYPISQFIGQSPYQGAPFRAEVLVRKYSSSPRPQEKGEPSQSTGDSPKESNPDDGLSEGRSSTDVGDADDEAPKGIVARFKDAYKNYGKVLVGVHLVTSSVWLGSFYYAAYLGIDVVPLLKWMGASDRFITPFESSGIGNLAVAYLLYKIATPARYTVTILGTKYTVEHLRKLGYMEPIPEGARIRDFVKESREQVREKYEDLKDDVKEKKDEYKEKYDEKLDSYKEKIEDKKSELKGKLKRPQN